MKNEHLANTALAQQADKLASERARWAAKLAPMKPRAPRPRLGFFARLFRGV